MPPSAVIILAAGEGTRMLSSTPKVLHKICGRPLVGHVAAAAIESEAEHIVVTCGHRREMVTEYLTESWPNVLTAIQLEQNGTGHAVRVTVEQIQEKGVTISGGPVVVVSGDSPLLTAETLGRLTSAHAESNAAVTVLSAILDDPTGYGRLVRGNDGEVVANIEHRDANEATRRINEINSGMYAFDPEFLLDSIGRLTTDNSQGEQYLPDLIGMARERDLVVSAVVVQDADEIAGVNNRAQLAECERIMRSRINLKWMAAGVTMVNPDTTYIDVDVDLEPDVLLEPGVILRGATEIHSGAVIGPDSTLIDTKVAEGARVNRVHAHLAVIGPNTDVGPFTFLRPGAELQDGAKAGAYVEIKNSTVGPNAKVPHLSYVGDATIGQGTNIGAATVFCNFDGVNKHRTTIGEEVRIGSDTMLVAPLEVGDGAYTAAGSVVTQDVPAGALAVGRGKQRNIQGWVAANRPGTPAAAVSESVNEGEGE